MGLFSNPFRSAPASKPKLPQTNARVTLGEMATRASAENMIDFLQVLPNPDPVLRKLGKSIEVYRELLVDEHLGSVIDTRKDAVRELEWSIDRGKAKSKQASAIKLMFDEIDMYQVFTEILDAPLFGYQPMELNWVDRDGLLWLDNIVGKPPEWFEFTTENEPRFKDKRGGFFAGAPLPPRKFIIPVHDGRYTNPYGIPVLSRCFWPVFFGKNDIKFWAEFTEKWGRPWWHGKYPDEWSQDQIDEMIDRADEMIGSGIMGSPKSMDSEIIPNGQKSSSDIFHQFIEFCEARISKAVLGHAAAADTTPGKLGNEEGAMTAKWGRASSDKRLVESVINQAIRWIHELNWGSGEPPVFSFFEEEDVDLKTAQRDQILFNIGWRPTPSYISNTYGMTEADFILLPGATPSTGTVSFAEASTPPSSPDPGQAAIDAQASKAAGDTSALDELTEQVLKKLDEAEDYEGAIALIAEAFPDLSTKQLEDDLLQRMAAAELAGRATTAETSADEEDDA